MIHKNINTMKKGRVAWECPSNIALVKYWGKIGDQLPSNPSVSMSLKYAVTRTKIDWIYNKGGGSAVYFFLDGKEVDKFRLRIVGYLERLSVEWPWLNDVSMSIMSENTFPHSAGIASSASAMGSLALCVMDIMQEVSGARVEKHDFFSMASEVARRGSGSAARSVYGGITCWGKNSRVDEADDRFAVPLKVHPVFDRLKDAVLMVDSGVKAISSSRGHQLMEKHPYAQARFKQAEMHAEQIIDALYQGSWIDFARIVEAEALSIHAMMMTAEQPYLLWKPNTIALMEKITMLREQQGVKVCYSLDAGPNLHLIYLCQEYDKVRRFIADELRMLLQDGMWLDDEMGEGPVKIV